MKKRQMRGAERRLYPRVKQELGFDVAADGYRFTTTTKDISCIGAYCRIGKYIPPFTKVAIGLALPSKNGTPSKNAVVSCKGVIVRTEDEIKGEGFNIAIFFNDIKETQRKKIAAYVNRFLPPLSAGK